MLLTVRIPANTVSPRASVSCFWSAAASSAANESGTSRSNSNCTSRRALDRVIGTTGLGTWFVYQREKLGQLYRRPSEFALEARIWICAAGCRCHTQARHRADGSACRSPVGGRFQPFEGFFCRMLDFLERLYQIPIFHFSTQLEWLAGGPSCAIPSSIHRRPAGVLQSACVRQPNRWSPLKEALARDTAYLHPYWCELNQEEVIDGSDEFFRIHGASAGIDALWPHAPALRLAIDTVRREGRPSQLAHAAVAHDHTRVSRVLVLPGTAQSVFIAGVPAAQTRSQGRALSRWRSDFADVVSAPRPQQQRIGDCLALLVAHSGASHASIVESVSTGYRSVHCACATVGRCDDCIAPVTLPLERFSSAGETSVTSLADGTQALIHPLGGPKEPLCARALVLHPLDVSRRAAIERMASMVGNWIGNILRAADAMRAAQQRDRLYAEVVRAMSDAVLVIDDDFRVRQSNAAAANLLGARPETITGADVRDLIQVSANDGEIVAWASLARPGDTSRIEPIACALPHRGGVAMIKGSCARLGEANDSDASAGTLVLVLRDVSHEVETMRRAEWAATHDALTGLHNRVGFERRMSPVDTSGQLICLDLDRFKVINDSCGHAAGDQVLRAIATIIRRHIRRLDVPARIGGDEFFVALPQCPENVALKIAEAIRADVEQYAYHDERGEAYRVSCSIGICAYHDHDSLQRARADADAAMYSAKRSGKNRVVAFERSPQAMARSSDVHWAHRIERAIDEDRIELWRQPIFDLQDNRAKGYEVLVRMRDDNGALVLPSEFIPPAERFDLIGALDRHIVSRIARHFSDVLNGGRYVSINLSGRSAADLGLAAWITNCFEQADVHPHQICIELTETATAVDPTDVLTLMQTLRRAGFCIALDDLGSGVASFATLRDLPVDIVKLDGGYVRGVAQDKRAQEIVQAVVQVARSHGIETVAEWIEDEATLSWVSQAGITRGQGFYLGVPEPIILENAVDRLCP
ncbi:putative bifunctional diguanylate cyclase/phosphodiesterase [Denitromonas ohlonensis]|uniref:putative bifunctional diguanylate cyclase/phosphodiesterase n=1 Tax=Denitromonas ohlonensis TaxID=3078508 RepID=UPI001642AC09|nr:EAL domain-containing protein [Denitromonas ohlonensis]